MNKWKVFTTRDAYQERGAVKYAASGLFEIPSVNIVYGASDTLKSLLLMDMSACVVQGLPWLQNSNGIATKATTKMGVLWVDFDNGVRRTHDRIKAIGAHYGQNHEDSFYYVSMPAGGLDMTDPTSIKDLGAIILPDVGLVIIDNLSCVIGNANENTDEMARVMSSFRFLAERHNLAFVIIHTGDTLFDKLLVETDVDLALHVGRQGSNYITISSTKTRGNDVALFGAYFHSKDDATGMRQGWFEGMDPDDIELIWEHEDMRQDLIFSSVTFVLLYKDGIMDIFPVEAYGFGELTMLRENLSYKTEWIPIGYGSYGEMQKCEHEIERNGLGTIRSSHWT